MNLHQLFFSLLDFMKELNILVTYFIDKSLQLGILISFDKILNINIGKIKKNPYRLIPLTKIYPERRMALLGFSDWMSFIRMFGISSSEFLDNRERSLPPTLPLLIKVIDILNHAEILGNLSLPSRATLAEMINSFY